MKPHRDHVLSLLKTHSVRVSPPDQLFKLASGELSRFYIDVKRTALDHQAHLSLACLLYLGSKLQFPGTAAVAGVALGGCHLASITAVYAELVENDKLDVVYVRKQAKDHGTKNLVECSGASKPGKIVLLEDVVTTGGSSMEAAKHLREAGYDVRGVFAVVDRRTERQPTLPDGTQVRSIYTLDDFADLVSASA